MPKRGIRGGQTGLLLGGGDPIFQGNTSINCPSHQPVKSSLLLASGKARNYYYYLVQEIADQKKYSWGIRSVTLAAVKHRK